MRYVIAITTDEIVSYLRGFRDENIVQGIRHNCLHYTSHFEAQVVAAGLVEQGYDAGVETE